jgi:hypothetical protein
MQASQPIYSHDSGHRCSCYSLSPQGSLTIPLRHVGHSSAFLAACSKLPELCSKLLSLLVWCEESGCSFASMPFPFRAPARGRNLCGSLQRKPSEIACSAGPVSAGAKQQERMSSTRSQPSPSAHRFHCSMPVSRQSSVSSDYHHHQVLHLAVAAMKPNALFTEASTVPTDMLSNSKATCGQPHRMQPRL